MAPLRDMKGWRVELCEYHWKVVQALPAEFTYAIGRAFMRVYNATTQAQIEGTATVSTPAKDNRTKISNIKNGNERRFAEGALLGVLAVLELQYEDKQEDEESKAVKA